MSDKEVFISYSRIDRDEMESIRDYIAEQGIKLWTDEKIEPGTPRWQRSIETAIKNASFVIILMSPDAKESEWVDIEISIAKTNNVPIIPILLRGNAKSAIPIQLINYQFIDFSSDKNTGKTELLKAIVSSQSFVPGPIPQKVERKLFSLTNKTAIIWTAVLVIALIIFVLLQRGRLISFISPPSPSPAVLLLPSETSTLPSPTSTNTSTSTNAPTSTNTHQPTSTSTSTQTPEPTEFTYEFGQDILNNCINPNLWRTTIGRPGTFNTIPDCLDLDDYGIYAEDEELKFIDPRAGQKLVSDIGYSEGYISFDFLISELDDSNDLEPHVEFAIVDHNNPDVGVFFIVQRQSISENFYRGKWDIFYDSGISNNQTLTNFTFKPNESYNLAFLIKDKRLTIFIDDIPIRHEDFKLEFNQFDLLIGHYYQPGSAKIRFYISNFIYDKE